MKQFVIYRLVRHIVYSLLRILPLWEKDRVTRTLQSVGPFSPSPPVNIDSLPKEFSVNFVEDITFPERRTFALKNVNVSGAGVVFRNCRVFLPSLCWPLDLEEFTRPTFLFQQWWGTPKVLPNTETVVLAHTLWACSNYYHWMLDTLPRLLMLDEMESDDALVIVPAPMPEYVQATLALLGRKRLLPLSMADFVKVPLLTMSERMNPIGLHNAGLLSTLRERLLSPLSLTPSVPKRKIYISRSRQTVRRLANEAAVQVLLNKYGFETMCFEGLSFEEQVTAMHETAVLISVHGANLTNMLFMQPGCHVFEMMNRRGENFTYYRVASIANVLYSVIPCEAHDNDVERSGMLRMNRYDVSRDVVAKYKAINDADLVVDIDELDDVLKMYA